MLVREATPSDLAATAGLPLAGPVLTETTEHYFPGSGSVPVDREDLSAALDASAELRGACPASARALLRPAIDRTTGERGGR